MFTSNESGFSVTFNNGWTVSVQWSAGNYCANRFGHRKTSCQDAEVAIMKQGKETTILGWQSPAEVATILKVTEESCPCGGDYQGSDHCIDCFCEQYETVCTH